MMIRKFLDLPVAVAHATPTEAALLGSFEFGFVLC